MEESMIYILMGGLGIAFFLGVVAYPLYTILKISSEIKRLMLDISTKAQACTVIPSKVIPISRLGESTISDLIDYHVVCNEIQRIVGQGQTEYSSPGIQYLCGMFKHGIITGYVWRVQKPNRFVLLSVGWVYLLINVALTVAQTHATAKLEIIFNKYFRGELIKNDSSAGINTKNLQTSSSADEISKLHKLKQDGILSEDEFQTAKRKLVG